MIIIPVYSPLRLKIEAGPLTAFEGEKYSMNTFARFLS